MSDLPEVRESFPCFGGTCTVIVSDGPARLTEATAAVAASKRRLLDWHQRFSRFNADSELSRLNADPRSTVPVSPLLRRIVEVAVRAGRASRGLVNPTLVDELEVAGYDRDIGAVGSPASLAAALELAPERAPGAPDPRARFLEFETDRRTGSVTRPPGARLDAGGIAKGVFADELAATLSPHAAFVVDCCGDLRLGGTTGVVREVTVQNPFDEAAVLHSYRAAAGAFATSGIGKRAWLDRHGRPAHHLLDPGTGRPAFTGLVQATARAPTAAEAEVRSKAALLSGPEGARAWLPDGGVIVFDDGRHLVV